MEPAIPKLGSGSFFQPPGSPPTHPDRALWAVVAQPEGAGVGDQLDSIAAKLGRKFPALAAHQRGGHFLSEVGVPRPAGSILLEAHDK